MEEKLQKRKRNRLQEYDYSSPGCYFVTVCTKNRKNYFWQDANQVVDEPNDVILSQYGKIANQFILQIEQVYSSIKIESYAIMPNHIHLLIVICADESGRAMRAPTISQLLRLLKIKISKQVGCSIWQKSFYDHIVRDNTDHIAILQYIYENPLCWQKDNLYAKE